MNATGSLNFNSPGVAPSQPLKGRILARTKAFPAMPTFVADLLKMMRDPDAEVSRMADRLKLDPGMTANVLRLANSARFGATRSIHSLHEAIVRLGMKQLFQVVVASGAGRQLARPLAGYELRPDELLAHSLWTGLAAEELCRLLTMPVPDMLFTAGMLHDLGKLVLDEFVDEKQASIRTTARDRSLGFDEAETEVLGLSHAEIGASILNTWHFPGPLVASARWHHAPDLAGEHQSIVNVVHIAEFLAYAEGVGSGVDGFSYRLTDDTLKNLGLNTRTIELVASHTLTRMQELKQIITS